MQLGNENLENENLSLGIVEREEHGSTGHLKCFAEGLESLYPDCVEITSENIFSLMLDNKPF